MLNAHKPEQRGRCAEPLEARTNCSIVVCTKSALIARRCDISRTPLGLMFAQALRGKSGRAASFLSHPNSGVFPRGRWYRQRRVARLIPKYGANDTGHGIPQGCAQCAAAAKPVPSRLFGTGLWHGTVDFL
jgi:hypothetical protein